MRLKDYSTLKAGRKLSLSKSGDVVSLTQKRFNSTTGESLSDSVREVQLGDYESEKAHKESEKTVLEVEISELAKIITDIKAL